jgi:hypothetical protein
LRSRWELLSCARLDGETPVFTQARSHNSLPLNLFVDKLVRAGLS